MAVPICPGPLPRREFLRAGTLALGGMSLPQLARAAGGKLASRETSVILFWMWGGPSQIETFDPKPNAPIEYRGPYRPIHTKVPGLDICEIFPKLAAVSDRFSIIRSVHHEMSSHNDGSIEMLTGKTPEQADPTSTAISKHPDMGMVTSRIRGPGRDGMPAYVGIPRKPFMTRPNYLGVSHTAFECGDPSVAEFRPPNLQLAAGLNGERLSDRKSLRSQFDRMRHAVGKSDATGGLDDFHAQAMELLSSQRVAEAFDIEKEPADLRDKYGRTLWGQSCLLARRLAEAGVSLITIDATYPVAGMKRYFSWDDHVIPQYEWDLAPAMQFRANHMDPALSALIEDLYSRDMDRNVLLVAMGEFGRTPRLSHQAGFQGRDHWPQSMSILVSGGGWKMGQVVGETNSKAEYPAQRPLSPQDMLASIYHFLGIDYRRDFLDFAGRPQPILHHGEPISELI